MQLLFHNWVKPFLQREGFLIYISGTKLYAMQLDHLKMLGLPLLEAQLHLTQICLNKALTIVRGEHEPTRVTLMVYNDPQPFTETFYFPAPGTFPDEFKHALQDYANRLVAEKHLLSIAIEQLKKETFSSN